MRLERTANVRDSSITSFDFRRNTEKPELPSASFLFSFSFSRHGTVANGFAGEPNTVVHTTLSPTRTSSRGSGADFGCRKNSRWTQTTLRHGRHNAPRHAILPIDLSEAFAAPRPITVVSLELTVPF